MSRLSNLTAVMSVSEFWTERKICHCVYFGGRTHDDPTRKIVPGQSIVRKFNSQDRSRVHFFSIRKNIGLIVIPPTNGGGCISGGGGGGTVFLHLEFWKLPLRSAGTGEREGGG